MRINWFFIWTNLNPFHPKMLCVKFGWNWLSGSGEEDFFFISPMYFCYFIILFPWKRAGPFIWTNLNPLHLRMLCAKFGWNWPTGSEEEDFFNFVNVFSQFHNYLPLEKGGALYLNKLESPSPKDALCQVWLKLAQVYDDDDNDGNGQILIRKAHLSLWLRWAKKMFKHSINHVHSTYFKLNIMKFSKSQIYITRLFAGLCQNWRTTCKKC